jgi:transposase
MEASMEATSEAEKQSQPQSAEQFMRQVRHQTRRKFTAEEKIRIVLEGMKREMPVTELCRREGIPTTVYYVWVKTFMEAGKSRLKGESLREASRDEVQRLKKENGQLKELLGEKEFALRLLKKSLTD